jgi:hypothetical protein
MARILSALDPHVRDVAVDSHLADAPGGWQNDRTGCTKGR